MFFLQVAPDPGLVDAVTKMVVTIGFPAALAIYLVRWVTNSLNGKLNRLADSVDHSTEKMDGLANKMDDLGGALRRVEDELHRRPV